MYSTQIKNQDEALCHLFFHCCYEDGEFNEAEVNTVTSRFVELGLQTTLNFKDELLKYKSYRDQIVDEIAYIKHLVMMLNPVHTRALYSYCVELLLSDSNLDMAEQQLLEALGDALDIETEERQSINKLMVERLAVITQKLF